MLTSRLFLHAQALVILFQSPQKEKLVISASILVDTAVIPPQAGALVEALLARQELKKKNMRSKTSRNKSAVNGESNDKNGNKFVLIETTFECPNCGSTMHWSAAQFCWSYCGDKFT